MRETVTLMIYRYILSRMENAVVESGPLPAMPMEVLWVWWYNEALRFGFSILLSV